MADLSKGAYEAIVVGSGFGGAVSACRLAQADVDVAVFERGSRFALGSFPRVGARVDHMSWQQGGAYDVRPLNDVLVVQAAGYGGGSLIYANVQIRPPTEVFADGWPADYSRATLDPYYDLVAHMLDIRPVENDPATGELPTKTRLMEDAAMRLGRSAQSSGRISPSVSKEPVRRRLRTGSARSSRAACTAVSATSAATSARRTHSTSTTSRSPSGREPRLRRRPR